MQSSCAVMLVQTWCCQSLKPSVYIYVKHNTWYDNKYYQFTYLLYYTFTVILKCNSNFKKFTEKKFLVGSLGDILEGIIVVEMNPCCVLSPWTLSRGSGLKMKTVLWMTLTLWAEANFVYVNFWKNV